MEGCMRDYIIRYFPLHPRWALTCYYSDCKDILEGAGRGQIKRAGVQGPRLNPLGLFLRASVPFLWSILSAFLPLEEPPS
jgi:hypothetical protein